MRTNDDRLHRLPATDHDTPATGPRPRSTQRVQVPHPPRAIPPQAATTASARTPRAAETLRVVVIGAGYAGVMAANRLAGHRTRSAAPIRVALVNPVDVFTERIRLHEALTAGGDASIPLHELLNEHVELVVGRATLVDRDAAVVRLDDDRTLPFDRVVIATGSSAAGPAGTLPLSTREHLAPLRQALEATDTSDTPSIRVIGGGLTGIEVAAELASAPRKPSSARLGVPRAGRSVELIDTRIVGGTLGARARQHARARLTRLGVHLVDRATSTPGAGPAPGALMIWAGGFRPVTVPIEPPVAMAGDGRIVVDAALRSPDDPRILAAGDCASSPASHVRASCAAALPLGAGAASTVIAEQEGGVARDVRVGFLGRCLSLGREYGLLDVARADDRSIGLIVGGRTGRLVKDQIMNRTTFWLRGEAARSGWYRGTPGPA
ncbi:pyridine nucleotide-disulfide oxidoreductase [Pseudoclavibacter endophyticus]|uniref:Pyridine nucleotide-disulfide oxidoreductase n=2 Tax=Pseudoclavibacter endophyticus TaxID=1778590 RepID=A0A6H9WMY4_9MICO|nr:pyridine nucleotide-disulfide oxidoreductase [Pseudoclavibacter endophyticus]